MNRTHTRRLLAGVAGLVIGMAGPLTLAGPASATEDAVPSVEVVTQSCEEVKIKFKNPTDWLFVFDYRVDGEDPSHDPAAPGVVMDEGPFAGEEFGPRFNLVGVDGSAGVHEQVVSLPFEAGSGEHTIEWRLAEGAEQSLYLAWDSVTVDCGQDQMPPEFAADFFPVVSCDFLVFFLNNTGEEDGVSFAFTPLVDAVHGHAPAFLEFLDDFLEAEPGTIVEIPDDTGLEIVGPVGAGETVGPLGPFPVGAAHAHGFEATDDLEVQVQVLVGTETVLDETFAWQELLGDLECPDDQEPGDGGDGGGGGGELPKTGVPAGLVAGGALALLVLGGGLYLAARRRRVTFTA